MPKVWVLIIKFCNALACGLLGNIHIRERARRISPTLFLAILYTVSFPAISEPPESYLAGVWRIIEAQPDPWANPHVLTKDESPLLEYAVSFGNGEVIGPSHLGCTKAKFSTALVEPESLFRGKLPKAKASNVAKVMQIQNTSLHVDCEGRQFDYHMDYYGNLWIVLDDVMYALQRPEGDPSKVKPGYSGPSFNCLKAKTAGEKMICLDAELSRSDLAMANAYERLKKSETPESFPTLQNAQRAWNAYVMEDCDATAPMPEDIGEKKRIDICLTDHYGDRERLLSNAEVVRSGVLGLEPRMRFFLKPKPRTEDSDIYPWLSGGPQAKAFNAYVEKTLNLSKRRMDDKELFAFGDDIPDNMSLYARRWYQVERFDERIVSLQIFTYDYTGGAHEVLGETSLNWDMAKGRPFSADELFRKDKHWRKYVTDFCIKELDDQFSGNGPERSAVEAAVADSGNWLFAKDHARVHFTVYSIASFSGGEFDVGIPYKKLKPYLKADAQILADDAAK